MNTRDIKEPENSVTVNDDLTNQAKDWCENNLKKYQWNYINYSNGCENTFSFENDTFKVQFMSEFLNSKP